jgi:hypothetical protein
MDILRLLPIFISSLLLAAHFMHSGLLTLCILSLFFPLFLIFRRPWAVYLVQAVLGLATVEWLRTLFLLVGERMDTGRPWLRLALILGGVAAWTALSSLVLYLPVFRDLFRLPPKKRS